MAKAKTERLPGMSDGRIKEISDAAELYEGIRDERMALTEREVETNAALVKLMEKHKLKSYKDDDYDPPLIVTIPLEANIKAKVRREKTKKKDE